MLQATLFASFEGLHIAPGMEGLFKRVTSAPKPKVISISVGRFNNLSIAQIPGCQGSRGSHHLAQLSDFLDNRNATY